MLSNVSIYLMNFLKLHTIWCLVLWCWTIMVIPPMKEKFARHFVFYWCCRNFMAFFSECNMHMNWFQLRFFPIFNKDYSRLPLSRTFCYDSSEYTKFNRTFHSHQKDLTNCLFVCFFILCGFRWSTGSPAA